MDRDQKAEAVRPLIAEGLTFEQISGRLEAPSRKAIAGICHRHGIKSLRQPSQQARNDAKPKAKSIAIAPNRTRNIRGGTVRAMKPIADKPDDLRIRHERRKAALGRPFHPLPGVEPIHLTETGMTRCKWPVDGLEGNTGMSCGAACEFGARYCDDHRAIAFQPRRQNETA
jgi:hypothetical protein